MILSPRQYGVPHDSWRTSQLDAFNKIAQLHGAGGGAVFAELPTGSGKSGVATALGFFDNVTILTSTLSLLDQYAAQYNVAIIKGRQEYRCVLQHKVDDWKRKYKITPTAHDCHFVPMQRCPSAAQCPYLQAKYKALHSQRMACSYKYASLSHSIRERSGILVFDECDTSVREMVSHAEMLITHDLRGEWGLDLPPAFPDGILAADQRTTITQWLDKSLRSIPNPSPSDESQHAARTARIIRKLDRTAEAIQEGAWFVGNIIKDGSAALVLRPLQVFSIVEKMMHNKTTLLCMSATIGNPEPLAQQLGLSLYQQHTYPHPVPMQYRPVYCLPAPRMTKTNLTASPNGYNAQGVLLARFLKYFPKDFRGIVLTSSHDKAQRLRTQLQRSFNGRIIEPQGAMLERLDGFMKSTAPGAILVDTIQGFGHGIDLYGDLGRFVAVAGVPFDNPTEPYIKAQHELDGGKFGMWCAYNAVVQACGRVTRGEKKEDGSWLYNAGILVDGSANTARAQMYYPNWFIEAMCSNSTPCGW